MRGLQSPCGHEESSQRNGWNGLMVDNGSDHGHLRRRDSGGGDLGSGKQGSSTALDRGRLGQGLLWRKRAEQSDYWIPLPSVRGGLGGVVVASSEPGDWGGGGGMFSPTQAYSEQEDGIGPCLGATGLGGLAVVVPGSRLACMQQCQPSFLLCASAHLCIPQPPPETLIILAEKICFGRGTEVLLMKIDGYILTCLHEDSH